jgi:cytochrome c553
MRDNIIQTTMLAALVLSAPAIAQQPAPAGNPAEAHKIIAMCEGCHGIPGYKTAYPTVYHVPKLGGQSEKYLIGALNAYKSGERRHPSMRGIAASLTDQDMANLAAYYARGYQHEAGHK